MVCSTRNRSRKGWTLANLVGISRLGGLRLRFEDVDCWIRCTLGVLFERRVSRGSITFLRREFLLSSLFFPLFAFNCSLRDALLPFSHLPSSRTPLDNSELTLSFSPQDEINRWQKYAYGVSELLFHPLKYWLTKGPFTPMAKGTSAFPRFLFASS